MELVAFLEDMRAAHIEHFSAVQAVEALSEGDLFSEIGLNISGDVHRSLYVADLLRRVNGQNQVVEVGPSPEVFRGPAVFRYRDMSVRFEVVSWDAMTFAVGKDPRAMHGFEEWFDRWLDVDRLPPAGDQYIGIIHSVTLDERSVSVDFGTAPAGAVIELFDVFAQGGASSVLVTDPR